MSVYTVHGPPKPTLDPLSFAERFVFVRDGFSWWAFLLAPLWMLVHRMWIVLACYVVLSAVIEAALVSFGGSRTAISIVGLMISLLIGFEASTLRRFALARRGWKNIGIISGEDLEDAERRFFDVWLNDTPSPSGTPSAAPASGGSAHLPRVMQTPNVIGLFPEPGGRR